MAIIQRAPKPASADRESSQVAAKAAATAPDSKAKKNIRGKREMFQVGFEPELLAEFDAARKQLGLSRPALIKIAVRRLLDAGV
ncbi:MULTISPECIES: ribbon-helix-helix protein, CopG family [Pseudomonas]|uniref:Uncharacterized protein n=23 Tax=Pseudomonas TaxID=286 RepID=F3GGU2_PSESJ|nr:MULTISPECIES: ribbon-helix-helix protein, CopG family [Pseudomonas]EGH46292.1 hypothetical protein PSYPI_29889 [Pseudomonas syringae pv. pisi str. 1704B]AAZ38111.1 hypothetical protein PSPPH_B0010 [Pseudomonas savastanoi pv. phaseolicola 1448A]AVB12476.1 ribbon-helix-helix protein, CopG family [Pseudomonas amygdali pv. morsprunorum]AZG89273.1 ribbon-helix-helix protein, CopG family [Pseudomonas syringae pv. pisi str. PP1]EFW77521.1 hypothetical protein PsgB076_28035 [Pseudomonas savastanoi 